jgi:hypothetical protein
MHLNKYNRRLAKIGYFTNKEIWQFAKYKEYRNWILATLKHQMLYSDDTTFNENSSLLSYDEIPRYKTLEQLINAVSMHLLKSKDSLTYEKFSKDIPLYRDYQLAVSDLIAFAQKLGVSTINQILILLRKDYMNPSVNVNKTQTKTVVEEDKKPMDLLKEELEREAMEKELESTTPLYTSFEEALKEKKLDIAKVRTAVKDIGFDYEADFLSSAKKHQLQKLEELSEFLKGN